MDEIYENRRIKIGLIKKKFRHWTDLNLALDWDATNPRLSRIFSGSVKSDTKKPYILGEISARHIEKKLNLPVCWLDLPATYADLNGTADPSIQALKVMEAIPQDKWPLAINLLKTLATDSAQDEANNTQPQSIKPAKFG